MKNSLKTVFKDVLGVKLDSIYGTDEEATRFFHAFDEASDQITVVVTH